MRTLESGSRAERAVGEYLQLISVDFIFQKRLTHVYQTQATCQYTTTKQRVADFFVPSLNLIIEVDGNSHRQNDDQLMDRIGSGHNAVTAPCA